MLRGPEPPKPAADYARSPVVYRVLREVLGPWAKANGYLRVRGTQARWKRPLNDGREFEFGAFVSWYGGGDIGGSSFDVMLKVGPPGGTVCGRRVSGLLVLLCQ
jgi:hypothetical protein